MKCSLDISSFPEEIYYSVIEKNEILPLVTIWINLETFTLSEMNKTEKEKCNMISFMCGI